MLAYLIELLAVLAFAGLAFKMKGNLPTPVSVVFLFMAAASAHSYVTLVGAVLIAEVYGTSSALCAPSGAAIQMGNDFYVGIIVGLLAVGGAVVYGARDLWRSCETKGG